MFNIDLKGKTVAITGASQGIGKAIAEVFAQSNASLILLSRNKKKLSALSSQLSARFFILDISKSNEVEEVFNKAGHIDILINNAGIHFTATVQEMDINRWKELQEINLNGAMYCTKAVLPKMIKKNYGRIINISSVSGKYGDPFGSAYSASKFALIGFTQSLAQEVAKHKITANCICPGWTETQMAEDILHDDTYAYLTGIQKQELKSTSLQAIPIGRYVHPNEVGYLSLYLASDYASAITGQAINICGGLCMH